MHIQVYAVGLYVDRTSAELDPFKSKADVAGDNELYKTLLREWSTPKVLRLVMVRTGAYLYMRAYMHIYIYIYIHTCIHLVHA
jgi:hypothetical protein